jgi:DHA2 family metal-tetracycline-proton antiporter-like MFS transporter
MTATTASTPTPAPDMKLFWACFIALVATSFVFGVRSEIIGELAAKFNLSEADKGEILGVGLWPFALSIIAFSFIIDRIGYKTAACMAVACHVAAIALTLFAKDKSMLYWGTFIVSIGNGVVESFINPVVATVFSRNKAKWLNILHAGWPAGIVLGVVFSKLCGSLDWTVRFSLCFIPVALYAMLILPRRFPVQERVAAGVSYRDMLREMGGLGFFLTSWLVIMGVSQMFGLGLTMTVSAGIGAVAGLLLGFYTRTVGNPMFLLILLTMPFLATTELGTDTWMPELLKPELGENAGLALAWSALLMAILRACAGPVVHRVSPIGLLVVSAAVAICGLLLLGTVSGAGIVIAAVTLYAVGKTFLWSTTLGMVSEQFPRGGALTLNGVSAVGVLGMGLLGSVGMGYFQDVKVAADLKTAGLYEKVAGKPTATFLGESPSVDADKAKALPATDAAKLTEIQAVHRKGSFIRQAVLPGIMLFCYVILFLWFRRRGGYRPVEIGTGVVTH